MNTNQNTLIYRGRTDESTPTFLKVSQLPGFNYGQPTIRFNLPQNGDDTQNVPLPKVGSLVEITHSPMLTRSIPPQTTALSITQIAPFSDGAVISGTIISTRSTPHGLRILISPLSTPQNPTPGQVALSVPPESLENITIERLISGQMVCAVTKGIATMSLPPQMPVHILLPYTP